MTTDTDCMVTVGLAKREHYVCNGCLYQMEPWLQATEIKLGRRAPFYLCGQCAARMKEALDRIKPASRVCTFCGEVTWPTTSTRAAWQYRSQEDADVVSEDMEHHWVFAEPKAVVLRQMTCGCWQVVGKPDEGESE